MTTGGESERSDMVQTSKNFAPPESARDDLIARLKRIEGQARGLQKMILEERSCEEIATQMAALKAAVAKAGTVLLSTHLVDCVTRDLEAGRPIDDIQSRFINLFGKLT